MNLGSEGGACYVDEDLPVHFPGHLQLLQDRKGLFLCSLEALCDYPGVETLCVGMATDEDVLSLTVLVAKISIPRNCTICMYPPLRIAKIMNSPKYDRYKMQSLLYGKQVILLQSKSKLCLLCFPFE